MELRVFTEPQQGASYDQLLAVARCAEDAGYGAFFRSDHYLKMGQVSGLPGPTDAWTTLAGLARKGRSMSPSASMGCLAYLCRCLRLLVTFLSRPKRTIHT